MRKIRCILLIFLIFVISPTIEAEGEYQDDFRYSVQTDDSLLSDSTDLNNPGDILQDLDEGKIFSYLIRIFKEAWLDITQTVSKAMGLVLLSVFVKQIGGSTMKGSVQTVFSIIVSVSAVLLCESSLRSCATSLQKAIENMEVFTAACIPSFSIVMIASGEGGGAAVFSALMVLLGEMGSFFSKNLLLPLTDVYLALGLCSVVGDEYNFTSISKSIRKFIIWGVGIFVLIFRTFMKLQISAAASGDRMTQKYIRFALGSLIPMVGNSLSQSVDGIFTLASGVKTSFAIAGVLIVLSIILPVLIRIGINGLIWSLCKTVGDFFQEKSVCSVADILANSFYMMLALGCCVALMGLFSFFGIMTQFSV